ncbi:glucose-methanol-choline oxidoreductase, FAD/NAD(P)-binding domain protein [Tanacetum coccineum]|uniref:Glucose-methanol-choline oxidoreductase, FAD/NAD(P)-binding domain protein n=1 Tax=Tanacetum coccineum TaxID=301880 RepID=A0ABQ5HF64_9ASTR
MGSHRVHKISTSVFITNFPDSFSAKDLFKTCSQYGYVVDAYIPNKRSKNGKRFGFVRFIKVFNAERLVNNLCTLWVGSYRLHANIVKFQRTPLNTKSTRVKNNRVVKGGTQFVNEENTSTPAMVLEEDCLNVQDLANYLMGRVKESGSLSNLKKVLANEGFTNIEIAYLGEFWVLIKFESEESKALFLENTGVGSWFSKLQQASMDLNIDGRITWVDIEGIPYKLWSENNVKCITSRWGILLQVDDQEEGCLHRKRVCIKTKVENNIFESFKIIHHGKTYWIRAKEVLGWVPDIMEDDVEEEQSDVESQEGDLKGENEVLKSCSNFGEDAEVKEVSETQFEGGSHNTVREEACAGQKDTQSVLTLYLCNF